MLNLALKMASRKEKDHYYEYIVVGCGGIGSGTLYWLSKRAGKGKSGKTFQVKKKKQFRTNSYCIH